MKASRFNHQFTIEGKNYLFNAFRRGFYEIEDEVASVLRDPAQPLAMDRVPTSMWETLVNQGFVVEDEFDEDRALLEEREAVRNNRQSINLTIAPTIDCNFGCPYCFEGADKPQERMSEAVMEKILEFAGDLADETTNRLNVTWFGGEPLLAMPQIAKLTHLFRTRLVDPKGWSYGATIITNGYGLTGECQGLSVDPET